MEMKTTVKFQYVATGMAKIKKTDNANYWWGFGATGTHAHYGGEDKVG